MNDKITNNEVLEIVNYNYSCINNPPLPKGSKLYFCDECDISRDIIRLSKQNYKVTYKIENADYIVYNELNISEWLFNSGWSSNRARAELFSELSSSDNCKYLKNSLERHLLSIKDNGFFTDKNKFVGILNVLKSNDAHLLDESEYNSLNTIMTVNAGLGLQMYYHYDLLNTDNYFYALILFNKHNRHFYNADKITDKYCVQIFNKFADYYIQFLHFMKFINTNHTPSTYYVNDNQDVDICQSVYNYCCKMNYKTNVQIIIDTTLNDFIEYIKSYRYINQVNIKTIDIDISPSKKN